MVTNKKILGAVKSQDFSSNINNLISVGEPEFHLRLLS